MVYDAASRQKFLKSYLVGVTGGEKPVGTLVGYLIDTDRGHFKFILSDGGTIYIVYARGHMGVEYVATDEVSYVLFLLVTLGLL